MKSIERRLAYDGMKGSRRHTVTTLFILILTFLLLHLTYQISDTIEVFMQKQRQDVYGAWNGAVLKAGGADQSFLEEHLFIEDMGTVTVNGSLAGEELNSLTGNGVGYFDPSAWEMSRMGLLDGRLPEVQGEIAMEATTLSLLGYEGVVGEAVSLEIVPSRNIPVLHDEPVRMEFILCGIVKDYQMNWSVCRYAEFPTAVITPEDGKLLGTESETQLLVSSEQYSYSVLEDIQNSEDFQKRIFINEEAYPVERTDTFTVLLRTFRYIIAGISAFIVILTIMFSIKKKETTWQYLYMLGCDYMQIFRIVLWEGVLFLVAAVIAGTVCSLLLYCCGIYGIRYFTDYDIEPVFAVVHYLYTLIQAGVVILLTFALSAIYLRNIQKAGEEKKKATRRKGRSRRYARTRPVRRINAWTLLVRQWQQRPGRLLLRILMITSVFLAVYGNLYLYSQKKKEIDGFSFSNPGAHTYDATTGFQSDGLTEEFLERLPAIYGVERVEAFRISGQFTINLSAYEETEYLRRALEDAELQVGQPVSPERYPCEVLSVRMLEDAERFMEAAGEVDQESFMTGEECLLVLPPYYDTEAGKVSRLGASQQEILRSRGTEIRNTELEAGDYIKVIFHTGEQSIEQEIKVGGIIETLPDKASYAPLPDNYGLITGNDFMQSFDVNPVSARYQYLNIWTTPVSEYLATDLHIAAQLGRLKQGTYQNTQEILSQMNTDMYTSMGMYLCLSLLYGILIILILTRMNEAEAEAERQRVSVMRALGRPFGSIRRQQRLGALIPGVAGAGLGTIFLLLFCFLDYRSRDIDIKGAVIYTLYSDVSLWYAHLICSLFLVLCLYAFSSPVWQRQQSVLHPLH